MTRVFEVRFEQLAQPSSQGRFSVPKPVVDILEITSDDDLLVEVTSNKGVMFKQCRMKSGREIYGQFGDHVAPGERIVVRVARMI